MNLWLLAWLPLASQDIAPQRANATIVVDATAHDGSLRVSMTWRGLSGQEQHFRPLSTDASYTYREVGQLTPDSLTPLPVRFEGGDYLVPGSDVHISYQVAPGGEARHGKQGAVEADWASVDGRIFMLPKGALDAEWIDLSFVLPDGWVAAVPFTPLEEGFRLTRDGALSADQMLATTCFGLGRFEGTEVAGGTSWAWGGFPEDHRIALARGTEQMLGWFRENAALESPYQTVWTPRSQGKRVFGGSSGLGACYEFPPGKLKRRNWQLLGHRIAHAQNKYAPHGMRMKHLRDRWFIEGWAAYAEVVSTESVGLAGDGSYLDDLLERHRQARVHHPGWIRPLADEARMPEKTLEYVHYTLAPLVAAHLDIWMQQRSGKTLTAFVKHLQRQHGGFEGAIDLRAELRSWSGDSYDDFWTLYVDQVAHLPPLWSSALEERKPTVGTAAGAPVNAPLLIALAKRFESVPQMMDWVVQAERRMADLGRRGVALAPAEILTQRNKLSGEAQADLLELAMAYPMQHAPQPPSRGCAGPTPLPRASFHFNPKSPTGMLLDRMATEPPILSDIERVAVRFSGDPALETLVVGDKDELQLMAKWISPPSSIQVELTVEGAAPQTKSLVIEPTWMRTWSTFPPSMRPSGEALLRFTVRDQHQVHATHLVWQVPGTVR